MRIAIRIVAGLLGAVGLLIGAAGVAGAWYVGRDDTVPLPPVSVTSDTVAVVTAPELIKVFGPTLHVTATDRKQGKVFVGVAHESDLQSYLSSHRYTAVTAFAWPQSVSTTTETSGDRAVAAPDGFSWWVAKAVGQGNAELSWPMVDGHYGVLAMPADGRGPVDLDLSVGLELAGLFKTGVTIAAGGFGAVTLAVLAFVLTRRRRPVASPMPVPNEVVA